MNQLASPYIVNVIVKERIIINLLNEEEDNQKKKQYDKDALDVGKGHHKIVDSLSKKKKSHSLRTV